VPSASAIFGADSPNFNFSNAGINGYGATNGTCYGVDDKSTKIVYFSPNFAGFSFAHRSRPTAPRIPTILHGAGTRLKTDGQLVGPSQDGPNSETSRSAPLSRTTSTA